MRIRKKKPKHKEKRKSDSAYGLPLFFLCSQIYDETEPVPNGKKVRFTIAWCGGWDLNPHANAHAPQTCLSADSSTAANSIIYYNIQNDFVKSLCRKNAEKIPFRQPGPQRDPGRRREGEDQSDAARFSSHLPAQPASTAAPRGRTPSLKTILGLWEPPWW